MQLRKSAWLCSFLVLAAACSTERDAPASGTEPSARSAVPSTAPTDLEPLSSTASSGVAAGASSPAPSALAAPPVAPAPTTPSGPLPSAREIDGLRVTPNADGTIRIEGTDRWGGDATTTYQSVDFLEPALPVLERSLTAPQVEGLRALVAELRGG